MGGMSIFIEKYNKYTGTTPAHPPYYTKEECEACRFLGGAIIGTFGAYNFFIVSRTEGCLGGI